MMRTNRMVQFFKHVGKFLIERFNFFHTLLLDGSV